MVCLMLLEIWRHWTRQDSFFINNIELNFSLFWIRVIQTVGKINKNCWHFLLFAVFLLKFSLNCFELVFRIRGDGKCGVIWNGWYFNDTHTVRIRIIIIGFNLHLKLRWRNRENYSLIILIEFLIHLYIFHFQLDSIIWILNWKLLIPHSTDPIMSYKYIFQLKFMLKWMTFLQYKCIFMIDLL